MDHNYENDTLILYFEGRIDTVNAPQVEKESVELLSSNPCKKLIVDAAKLEYISSAGLRVLLRLKKMQSAFSIIEVSSEVYDILEVTGFSEIFEVQKAMRIISIEGCQCIGRGATGAVYRLDPEHLVKVYFGGFNISDIQKEKRVAQNAFLAGVPTAISFDVVKVEDNGYGLIYELVDGKDLAECIANDTEHLEDYARIHADLLRECHKLVVDPEKFENVKARTLASVPYLSDSMFTPEEKEKIKAIISNIPDRDTYIHGDAHVGNVMMMGGEPVFIDMMGSSYGHPIFDLLSMYHIFYLSGHSEESRKRSVVTENLTGEQCIHIWNVFLSTYLGTEDQELLKKAEKQIAVVRSARFLLATIRFPQMFPQAYIDQMKQMITSAYNEGLEPICF